MIFGGVVENGTTKHRPGPWPWRRLYDRGDMTTTRRRLLISGWTEARSKSHRSIKPLLGTNDMGMERPFSITIKTQTYPHDYTDGIFAREMWAMQ
jgi:hypothetical protein